MTLTEFFRTVYRPLRLRGRSENTSRLYAATIAAFRRWLVAEKIADEPRLEHLEELLLARYLEDRQAKRSPYTAEKERSQLMSLARLAHERRLLDRIPTCPPAVLPDRVPTSWSEEELRRLFAQAGQARGMVGPVPASEWFPAAIAVAFESGERIGALLLTKRADYQRPTLTVSAESRKGKRRGRVYRLSEATCDRLDALAVAGSEYLLPWPFHHTYLWSRLKKILADAKLSGKRIGFHQVRRSAISHIAAAGGDPVQFAGHASAAMTKKWYLDPRYTDRGPAPHELLPRLDQGHESAPPHPSSQCAPRAEIDGPPGERPAA